MLAFWSVMVLTIGGLLGYLLRGLLCDQWGADRGISRTQWPRDQRSSAQWIADGPFYVKINGQRVSDPTESFFSKGRKVKGG